jgi:3-oxoacyl-[acyl-carrier protein] reductase
MENVLITGGSRGIGRSISEIFKRNGFKVFIPTRNELNLENRESIQNFINNNQHIYFSVIVNCAGINELSSLENITQSNIDKTLQINLVSPLLLIQGFVNSMKNQRYGKIVNIGSIWSVVSKINRTTYSMSKHGLDGITKTLSIELAPYNILVNTVCPGFTLTDLTKQNNTEQEISDISNQIPLRRMANPVEISEVVFFLASKNNSYVTGQKIIVDGGFTNL